jgi:ribosomal protein L7/L12
MAEAALAISIFALIIALMALSVARSAAALSRGPVPNVLRSEPAPAPEAFAAAASSAGISAQVAALVAQGKKIEAIKQYRTETRSGLKEAKDAVEAFERGVR